MIDGEFRWALCNLAITQATYPQNQAGKKHVCFVSRQLKATLHCINSGCHDKPEIHSDSTHFLQPTFGTVRLLILFKTEGDLKNHHFSTDAEVEAAVCKWISSQPKNFFIDGMKKWRE
jgi:hypothetical protein